MNTNLDYQQTLEFMFTQLPMYQRQGKSAFKKDLNNILSLMSALGDSHLKLKCIHIAGTNGKGTVSHLIAGFLQVLGFKVGVYTSPHYKDFRERIKINSQFISEEQVVGFISDNQTVIENIQPSFFEMSVAMAFDHFAKENVDFAIIETGLGGRLDSTNIVTPLMSVITNISMDHQAMLGDTLDKIAFEKAGIIKPQIPILIGERQEEVSDVFISAAEDRNAPIFFADQVLDSSMNESKLTIHLSKSAFTIDLPDYLNNEFQLRNIQTAIASFLLFNNMLFDLELDIIKSAVQKTISNLKELTYYIGRWEILNKNPLVIADSAHNEAGLRMALDKINKIDAERLHFVLAFVSDKDHKEILNKFPKKANYYFSAADIQRAFSSEKLLAIGEELGLECHTFESVNKAYQAALEDANKEDLVYVGGSIFTVAEIL